MTPKQATRLTDAELEAMLVGPLNLPHFSLERRLTENDRRALIRWAEQDRRGS
jgi:hypothetical protein